jgi:hypothetical protein
MCTWEQARLPRLLFARISDARLSDTVGVEMSRVRFRVVLILLMLILILAAFLYGLLTYWPDLFGLASTNSERGADGQIEQLVLIQMHGLVGHESADALTALIAGQGR